MRFQDLIAAIPEPARISIRKPARAAGFAAITTAMAAAYKAADMVAVQLRDSDRDRDVLRDEWTARWSHALLRLFGVSVQMNRALPPKDPARGRLVVANHRSTIDIAVLLGAFGGHMVSRADLGEWPVLGPAARLAGTLFVDRARASSGAELIREMRDRLRVGATINIFPEGTTFAGDEVHPFHPGGFAAAYRSDCEIVPVGLAYETGSGAAFTDESFLQHLSRMSGAAPTCVAAFVGEPFSSQGLRTAEMTERAYRAVSKCTNEARRIVDA